MTVCIVIVSTVAVLAVLVLSAAGIASDGCVNSFSEFEKVAITDNSELHCL